MYTLYIYFFKVFTVNKVLMHFKILVAFGFTLYIYIYIYIYIHIFIKNHQPATILNKKII